jgi:hypothetical protein
VGEHPQDRPRRAVGAVGRQQWRGRPRGDAKPQLDQAVALAVFIVIATLGVGAPVAIYFVIGDRATKILGELHDWMARENATIMTGICLIIGAKLIGDAITALSAG